MPSFLAYNSSNEVNSTGKIPPNWELNVLIKPPLFNSAYARAYVSESTWISESKLASDVLCSIVATSVIDDLFDVTVNVIMNPSLYYVLVMVPVVRITS